MKYSKNFDRDYEFYRNNMHMFNFCGTLNPRHEAIGGGDKSAKECLFHIESNGTNYPCCEPDLLNSLLLCKSGINFQIKQWAEGMAEGTLFLFELSQRYWSELSGQQYPSENICLEWVNNEPVYYKDIETLYGLPQWVITAVLNQSKKLRSV